MAIRVAIEIEREFINWTGPKGYQRVSAAPRSLIVPATRCGITSRLGLVIQKMVFSDSFLPPTHGWNLEIQFLSVQIVGSQLEGITRVSVKSSRSQTAVKYTSQNAPSSQS